MVLIDARRHAIDLGAGCALVILSEAGSKMNVYEPRIYPYVCEKLTEKNLKKIKRKTEQEKSKHNRKI